MGETSVVLGLSWTPPVDGYMNPSFSTKGLDVFDDALSDMFVSQKLS